MANLKMLTSYNTHFFMPENVIWANAGMQNGEQMRDNGEYTDVENALQVNTSKCNIWFIFRNNSTQHNKK